MGRSITGCAFVHAVGAQDRVSPACNALNKPFRFLSSALVPLITDLEPCGDLLPIHPYADMTSQINFAYRYKHKVKNE
jgi:hypothetical protein